MKIVIDSGVTIYDVDESLLNLLKKKLTFDNPKYQSALKFGRSRYISIPKYLMRYETFRQDGRMCVRVPIGALSYIPQEILKSCDLEDKRVVHDTKYPPIKVSLRNDQEIAKNTYLKDIDNLNHKNIVQLPTGKGKSILAIYLAYTLKQKTLVLVHKNDLVVGWTKDIKMCFGEKMDVGLIKAKSRKVSDYITIATIQTLSKMSDSELGQYLDQFGFVVQDEVHRTNLGTFDLVDKFRSKYKLGLSATPTRSDGMNFVFDIFYNGLCYKHIITEDDEDIAQVKVIKRISNSVYKPFVHDGVVLNEHDFRKEELPKEITYVADIPYEKRPTIPFHTIDNSVVSSNEHLILVCRDILNEFRMGRSCLVLFTQKAHIEKYFHYLCNFIPKDEIILYYGDNKEKTEVLMQRAESKQAHITLGTLSKTTEGTNVKSWEVLFLVSSMSDTKNITQAVGRIRRKKEGKINPVLVYDYRLPNVYSQHRHGALRDKAYEGLKLIYDKEKSPKKDLFVRGYR